MNNLQKKIHFINSNLKKYEVAIIIYDPETSKLFCIPSAVRGNAAYSYQRDPRYKAIQESIVERTTVDFRHRLTNAFMCTLTYRKSQYNPSANHIATFRKNLKRKNIHHCIIATEAHLKGTIHYHAVIMAEKQYNYYVKNDKALCDEMRSIIKNSWSHGNSDVKAITKPAGAGNYVMKELIKQSNCEKAVKKYNTGKEELTDREIKQIHTVYYGLRYKRRLLSMSKDISKRASEIEAEKNASADLISILNNADSDPPKSKRIVLRIGRRDLEDELGRPPPYFTGEILPDDPIFETLKALVLRRGEIEYKEVA